jgi:translocator protein
MNVIKLLVSLLIPLAVGGISGYLTSEAIPGWYATLQKPSFNPPNWIFGPVWTTLYLLMGIGFFMVWRLPATTPYRNAALGAFAIQLTLNFFWSLIFFRWHQLGWAFAEIICMWIFILITIYLFHKVKPIAGYLQIPYILWVSFASVLNLAIWKLN